MGKRLIIPPYKSAVNLSKIFLEKLIISLKIYLAGNTSICDSNPPSALLFETTKRSKTTDIRSEKIQRFSRL